MGTQDAKLNRRSFLRCHGARLAVYGGIPAVAAYAWFGAKRLVVDRHRVRLPRLPESFAGFRIVQLSDLHRGAIIDETHVRKAVRLANELRPDLLCLTGDYVSGSAKYARSCARAIGELSAPRGVVATLGNHDHWTDAESVRRALREVGVRVLGNRSIVLEKGGQGIAIAGVDDVWEKAADLNSALGDVAPRMCTILLAHEPDFADEACTHSVDLQLSGHSHGGQVWLPGIGALILPPFGRKYPRGWREVGQMKLYVNRGVGCVAPPVRLNCPAEVTLLELLPA